MQSESLKDLVVEWLDGLKAHDVVAADVRGKTTVADFFVIATSTSGRHGQALANRVVKGAKTAGCRPFGMEGYETSDWILIDLGDVVIHVMQLSARRFYDLEGLWLDAPP